MSTQEVIEKLDKGVLWITLNRPERLNALTQTMMDGLRQTLERAAVDDAVRVVVLAGAGKGFCAGGDIGAMAERPSVEQSLESRAQQLRRNTEASLLLHGMAKPTIAMARGAVAGAGLSLALACDILIASETLKMTSAFVKVGLSGDFGGTYFLTQRLGHKAREFALLSPLIGSQEALELGLINRAVSDEELEQHTRELAETLAAGPGITQGHIKANLNFVEQGATLAELLDIESLRHIRCGMTEDHREAATAFVEKRPPVFRNR